MALTTVLLADLPQTFEDLLRGILGQHPGLAIRSGSIAEEGLIAAATLAGAAVVVLARADPADLQALDPGYGAAAGISVLALTPDGTWACLHRLDPWRRRLDDISAAEILAAASGAVG
ncbi:hypothetical protein [Siccirubricoccus sp. G192]|uniref:hypothetical protein n=1 Tax=Siccirubricoccus sp. G192 TaxID=2849651 RepID=UPI001C2BE127|nr:hypothetical protein [Siccirubricoccus sp. G192]MBV1796844.1 hypothetical protein [Siccirubricoccus sp. G192]